jgi:catechol 2,3-dioxygenase-like lactoylglutathione lyase family enzyme
MLARMVMPALVPELQVSDFCASLAFYTEVLGFAVAWSRPEEGFAFLEREEASVMIEQAGGPGRRITTGPLEQPFGRGVNFQIVVSDVDALAERLEGAGHGLIVPLEERWYRRGTGRIGQRQFVVADPDGYLLRFARLLGSQD